MKVIPLFRKFDYYSSIDDMPIWNWLKVQETNDLRYVLKKYGEVTKKESSELAMAVQKMTDQYIDTFGISDEYRKILTLKRDIRVLEIDYVMTGDRSKLTLIEYKTRQLNFASKKGNKTDSGAVKVYVSKYMGFQVNFKQMTVKEFYSILKEISIEAKRKTA